GRTPPGRPLPALTADEDPRPSGEPTDSASSRPTATPTTPVPRKEHKEHPFTQRQTVGARATGPVLTDVLPLGAGLLLTGLGLGFLALRLRR
ncbi:hypothetical protein G3I40_20265, partial [Streptomyces sp. SID14478]|nr:hypothetical protein [Streptomyces sp. SID14478]